VEVWIVAKESLGLASDIPHIVKLLYNNHDPSSSRYLPQVMLFACSRPTVYIVTTWYVAGLRSACTRLLVAGYHSGMHCYD
jgi:hypothetical protein